MTRLNYDSIRFKERSRKVYYPDSSTNVPLKLNGPDYILNFGKHKGTKLKNVPQQYLEWAILNLEESRATMFAREYKRRENLKQ